MPAIRATPIQKKTTLRHFPVHMSSDFLLLVVVSIMFGNESPSAEFTNTILSFFMVRSKGYLYKLNLIYMHIKFTIQNEIYIDYRYSKMGKFCFCFIFAIFFFHFIKGQIPERAKMLNIPVSERCMYTLSGRHP